MDDLIGSNSEAVQFCESIISDLTKYSIDGTEIFSGGVAGVFATSNPDSYGDIIAVRGLHEFVESQKKLPMFVNTMHDTSRPPIGRVLASRVFQDSSSDSHFIAGVIGLYSPAHYKDCSRKIESTMNRSCAPSDEFRPVRVLFDDFDLKKNTTISFEGAPQWVERNPRRLINKGVDATQVVMISCGTMIASSFAGGFFSESGKQFFTWLKNEVVSKLRATGQKNIIALNWKINDVLVEAHIDTTQYSDFEFAWQKLQPELDSIEAYINRIGDQKPLRVVLSFDETKFSWGVAFIVMRTGAILTSMPVEAPDLEKMKGLSIGATGIRELPPSSK
jgi:hypothetical protein